MIFVATTNVGQQIPPPLSCVAVFGSRSEIRDPVRTKLRIRVKHPGSATPAFIYILKENNDVGQWVLLSLSRHNIEVTF